MHLSSRSPPPPFAFQMASAASAASAATAHSSWRVSAENSGSASANGGFRVFRCSSGPRELFPVPRNRTNARSHGELDIIFNVILLVFLHVQNNSECVPQRARRAAPQQNEKKPKPEESEKVLLHPFTERRGTTRSIGPLSTHPSRQSTTTFTRRPSPPPPPWPHPHRHPSSRCSCRRPRHCSRRAPP